MSKTTTNGIYSYDYGKFDVNMSSIWNELLNNIHFVENYKSDLICDIESVKQIIKTANPEDGFGNGNKECVRWIGFRKDGVDHYEYIRSTITFNGEDGQINNGSRHYYRKLYKLTLKIDGINMVVYLKESDAVGFVDYEKKLQH